MEFNFKHMKSPAWCSDSARAVYFKVIMKENNEEHEIGYIGCQENDFGRGLCNNFCYKTFDDYRGKGYTKSYIKQFVNNRFLDLDCIRARVNIENIASQKVLEYAGFENRGYRDGGEYYGFTWKSF